MKEIEIGKISHYFNHISVAAMRIDKGELRKGDRIHVKGHSEDFVQEVASMQKDHEPIEVAKEGDDIGFKVDSRVHEGDTVYKMLEA